MQKKGQAGVSKAMTGLIGAVIVVFLVVALAPEIFSGLSDLEADVAVPAWISTVLFVVVGAGIVFIVYRAMTR